MGALLIRRNRETATAEDVHEDVMQFLTFQLNGETFAVGILAIKEILEYAALTQVPLMPPFIRGVMNLRGAVVPVIDLAVRFGQPETIISRRTCIVIMELGEEDMPQYVGVVVDQVHEVIAIRLQDIEPPPQFGSRIRVDFISGMAKIDGRFVVLLEIGKVLSIDEMVALASIGSMVASDAPEMEP